MAGGKLLFDFLKKKIGGFIDGLTKKEEAKEPVPEEPQVPEPEGKAVERIEEAPGPEPEPRNGGGPAEAKADETEKESSKLPKKEATPVPERKPKQEKKARPSAQKAEKPKEAEKAPAIKEPERHIPAKEAEPDFLKEITKEPAPAPPEPRKNEIKFPEERAEEQEQPKAPAPKQAPPAPELAEKPKERIKLGIVGTVKSMITREVEISEKDVGGMLDSLELELLEADVDLTVAEGIKAELGTRLLGAKVKKDELHSYVSEAIRETLVGVLKNGKAFDIAERAESAEKPLKVAFLGINGAGKTTTIAKVAKLLMGRRKKVVFAAADTFRAAAIEQMSVHGDRLGVKVIKRDYGSDPTSVAYDAVNYARAHGIDAVLIDTAGRQDTNISLINEMKKLDRVIKPDIKIYIGESIAGNAIIEQISAFNREIGIDAVILTKLDCDPKGGTMLSISKATGIPIIYVGVGQGYDDLERFDPESIVRRILD